MVKNTNCPFASNIIPESPYDELSHEVHGNLLSVRVNKKNVGKIKKEGNEWPDTSSNISATCQDSKGNKCPVGCVKVKVHPNKSPPIKQPDEETFLLHATRQILNADEMRNSLEIELRTPKNYRSLVDVKCPSLCTNDEDKSDQEKNSKKNKKKKKK